ncbi:hypothetical protein F0562_021587 [Nyssa sinensis]|uniref:OVATE domain-containing protein n=1 Tax=Nyssa sinensis TaxID=561372 RepID=A0A5J5BPF1_9ASTE|nr:hypothetical protein F0562_021587 [Nyssa sinensis]
MKVKVPVAFNCKKLLNPCSKILQIFKLRFKKPLFIRRALRSHSRQRQGEAKKTRIKGVAGFLSVLCSLKQSRKMDRVMELKSTVSDAVHHKAPFPSPITPAYVRMSGANKKEVSGHDEVEDACTSFENYLMEMIVEKGKVTDLMDVEELLYCWKNLR